MSSSNCCDPWGFHLFLRNADGSFAPRQRVTFAPPGLTPEGRTWRLRGHNRPHLLDWDGDGRTDLVLDDGPFLRGGWALQVGAGPLRGRAEVGVKPFPLPGLPDRNPYDFEFADWDGDGRFDVLMAGAYLNDRKDRWLYDIYWFRNTSRRGEPRFDPPVRLLTAPAQSGEWQYSGYAVADRGRAGRPDLVVSVHKAWNRGDRWTQTGRLWRFRR